VTWGALARPGFVVEHVVAWDADEALALAAARRPDLERPRVALLADPAPPPAGEHRPLDAARDDPADGAATR
jgi:hypothetical protein